MEWLDVFVKIAGALKMVYGGFCWVYGSVAKRRKKDLFAENYASCVQVEGYCFDDMFTKR